MKEAFMCASIITAIILCLVGIIKLPFKSFKEKHPNWYKVTFYLVSAVLAIVAPIISELYILNGQLLSTQFAVLITATIAGVFGLYSSYEGTKLKELVKIIIDKIAKLLNTFSDAKIKKMIGSVGIDKINQLNEELKEEKLKKQQAEELSKREEVVIEEQKEETPTSTSQPSVN